MGGGGGKWRLTVWFGFLGLPIGFMDCYINLLTMQYCSFYHIIKPSCMKAKRITDDMKRNS